jgi:hypothetical protein
LIRVAFCNLLKMKGCMKEGRFLEKKAERLWT